MNSLYEISKELQAVYDKLENGDGINLETGEIDEETSTALALNQQNLQAKAIDYGYMIKSFDDTIDIYDKEIKRLTERKKALQNTKDRLKTGLQNAMEHFGIVDIQGKTIRINFRKSESIEVDDVALLEDRFTRIEIEADKTAIKEALKNGEQVKGARIIKNRSLQIR